MTKRPTIRIAQEDYPGMTRVEVQREIYSGRAYPVSVAKTPQHARMLANTMASECGGIVYRGHLSDDWAAALSDIPRSPVSA